ncbi:hypothetical protein ACHAXA_007514 [Cyclostephanos tholiformis]|uniref:Uncharacterized protein n=1 Tax=Cyclostephanos tholiformis TaxID=382380 RepID=A0ABD3RDH6_9STRA
MLRDARSRDPEYVYGMASNAARIADGLGRTREYDMYVEEMRRTRRVLPQFNLEGLWVGKYGSHGFEMINVTYTGDRLVAYKVTGDRNIPRGEITFTADLSVRHDTKVDDVDVGSSSSSSSSSYAERRRSFPGSGEGDGGALDPIHLSEGSAKKWGTRRLSRFRGSGHVSEPGYKNRQFLEGQLVVIGGGEYFSFAWVPLEYQIFFGRPSPELALKMLREGGGTSLTAGVGLDAPGPDANVRDMTEYAGRCLEVTCDVMCDESREGKVDPFSCIWHGDDDEYCYFE